MPDTVEEIGQYAFWGADSLEHLSVSDSLQEVSPYAFSNAGGLKSVALNFNTEEIVTNHRGDRETGFGVRLVRDAE